MRTASPNAMCGRILTYLATLERPVSTREVADAFNLPGTVASAQLCQLLKQGRVKKAKDVRGCGQSGHQSTWVSLEPAPARWGAYYLHPDGWYRLTPPTNNQIGGGQ